MIRRRSTSVWINSVAYWTFPFCHLVALRKQQCRCRRQPDERRAKIKKNKTQRRVTQPKLSKHHTLISSTWHFHFWLLLCAQSPSTASARVSCVHVVRLLVSLCVPQRARFYVYNNHLRSPCLLTFACTYRRLCRPVAHTSIRAAPPSTIGPSNFASAPREHLTEPEIWFTFLSFHSHHRRNPKWHMPKVESFVYSGFSHTQSLCVYIKHNVFFLSRY